MSTQALDITSVNSKNIGNRVGDFCGTPIREMFLREIELDQVVDVRRILEINRESPSTFTAELLPGEVICSDGIVRRDTAAEAIGYDEFHTYKQPEDAREVTIAEGRILAAAGALVTFRPDRVVGEKEFALVHGEAQ